jgi:hypothetical protein
MIVYDGMEEAMRRGRANFKLEQPKVKKTFEIKSILGPYLSF